MRFSLVDEAKKDFPVHRLCHVLGISQSGYFAWKDRPASKRQHSDMVMLAHAGLDASGFQRIPEPIGVIAAIAEQPLCLWQLIEQGCRAGIVADLPGGHKEAQRTAVRVAHGVQLRVHAPFGATDEAPKAPFMDGSPLIRIVVILRQQVV